MKFLYFIIDLIRIWCSEFSHCSVLFFYVALLIKCILYRTFGNFFFFIMHASQNYIKWTFFVQQNQFLTCTDHLLPVTHNMWLNTHLNASTDQMRFMLANLPLQMKMHFPVPQGHINTFTAKAEYIRFKYLRFNLPVPTLFDLKFTLLFCLK
jgi:hypothetical protein